MAEKSAAPPKKSSAFLKALLDQSRAKSKVDVNDEDFFSRSDQTYAILAAEEEARKKKKKAEEEEALKRKQAAEVEAEKRRKAEKERTERLASRSSTVEREGKRRRISGPDDDDDHLHDNAATELRHSPKQNGHHTTIELIESSTEHDALRSPISLGKGDERRSPRSSSRYLEKSATSLESKRKGDHNQVVDLLDSDDEESNPKIVEDGDTELQMVTNIPKNPDPHSESLGLDDEFPELARAAREQARRKRLQEDLPPVNEVQNPSPRNNDSFGFEPTYRARSESTVPPEEPVIQILITSTIPGTTPFIVQRKLGQRLKEARVEWSKRQNFPPALMDSILLTWKGKQIYDSTTCKGLGIGLDADGNIVQEGQKDFLGEENRQIHMIAMSQEEFDNRRRAKQLEAERRTEDEPEEVPQQQPAAQEHKEPRVRLILKAKDFADFKLIVKPSNPISRLLNAFRKSNEIPEGKDVYVLFDGERLESDSTVADNDIGDMDTLDVYVK